MTADEVAAQYGLPSPRTLRTMRAKGMPAVRLGKAYLYEAADVEHIASGIVAEVCTERSQHRNLEIARAMIEAGLTHPKYGGESEMVADTPERACACCGGNERLQDNWGAGGLNDVCQPCFYIWYDGPVMCMRDDHYDQKPHVHPEDIGEYSRKAKAEGTWPWEAPNAPSGLRIKP